MLFICIFLHVKSLYKKNKGLIIVLIATFTILLLLLKCSVYFKKLTDFKKSTGLTLSQRIVDFWVCLNCSSFFGFSFSVLYWQSSPSKVSVPWYYKCMFLYIALHSPQVYTQGTYFEGYLFIDYCFLRTFLKYKN